MSHGSVRQAIGMTLALAFASGCLFDGVEPEDDVGDAYKRPPPPGGGGSTISGTVYDENGAPVAGAGVFFWVWNGSGGGSAQSGWVTTNASGQYTKTGLPASGTALVEVSKSGYWQTCVTQQAYSSPGGTINALIHSDAYLAGPDPQPPANASPVISGVVYHVVGGVEQPIANATVWIDMLYGLGLVAGITRTNSEGEYFACRIPAFPNGGATLQFTAEGFDYTEAWVDAVDATLDVEMTAL